MEATTQYPMGQSDMKAIRALLVNGGLKVTQLKLGSNRFHAMLNTSDNTRALEILSGTNYDFGYFDKKSVPSVMNVNNVKVVKINNQTGK